MASATMKKINTIIFGYVLMMILVGCCSATVYKVGGSDGWIPRDEDDNEEWFKDKEFHVGDSLVFEYDPILNDVTQVSGPLEYFFCESSSPKAVYTTGHDVVNLTEPGDHYFISSNQLLCELGQKISIVVAYDPSSPIPPPSPSNVNFASGKTYKVGGSKGWVAHYEDSEYYNKWSEEKQFQVGDKLLFEYDTSNKLDFEAVVEINSALEFMSCDPISPVELWHKTGYDLVTLTEPGVHYFITTKTRRCLFGQKLRVMVGSPTKDDL